jgi:hypothetical protein
MKRGKEEGPGTRTKLGAYTVMITATPFETPCGILLAGVDYCQSLIHYVLEVLCFFD